MDAFEAARLKYAKNRERKERTEAVEIAKDPEAPKKKAERIDSGVATIEVVVTLPDAEHRYTFVKLAVYQNAIRSKLTRNEIRNRILEGLRPLLGGVKEL
jgi:hypothetical protein